MQRYNQELLTALSISSSPDARKLLNELELEQQNSGSQQLIDRDRQLSQSELSSEQEVVQPVSDQDEHLDSSFGGEMEDGHRPVYGMPSFDYDSGSDSDEVICLTKFADPHSYRMLHGYF